MSRGEAGRGGLAWARPEAPPTGPRLVLLYALFAAVATGVNIGSQALSLAVWSGAFALPLAMAFGTGTGLVTKYVLDKRWIFVDRSTGLRAHGEKFTLYTVMGVVTTLIFWGTELAFAAVDPDLAFVGAVVGLTIGYVTKYRLDRRFVFRRWEAAPCR